MMKKRFLVYGAAAAIVVVAVLLLARRDTAGKPGVVRFHAEEAHVSISLARGVREIHSSDGSAIGIWSAADVTLAPGSTVKTGGTVVRVGEAVEVRGRKYRGAPGQEVYLREKHMGWIEEAGDDAAQ